MMDVLQGMLDSGWLFILIGAAICFVVGGRAVRRMFGDAAKAEPPEPPRRHDRH